MKQSSDFAKGACWGAGVPLHFVGDSICVEDADAAMLIERHKASPPPLRRQKKPRPRRRKAVPA